MQDLEWFKSALNSMRDLVLIKGPNSSLLWANKAFLDYYGMSVEDLENIVDGTQSDPDDTLQYVKDDQIVFDTKTDLNIPSEPVTNSKGEVRYFHTVKSPIFDGDVMTRSIGVSRLIDDDDMLQQKPSDLDAKAFTAPLRSIIDILPTKTMLLDLNMRVIKCNKKWKNKLGDAPENSSATFTQHFTFLSPLINNVKKSIKEKKDIERAFEFTLQGQKYFIDFKISPWKYPDGTIGGSLIVATDITESKKKEKKLEQLSHRLTLALDASKLGVWEWDLETNELIWDKAMYKLYGLKEDQFSGAYEAWESGLHPDDKERSITEIQVAIEKGEKFDTEFRVCWPCGEIKNIRAMAGLVYENGQPKKMVGVNWDITSEKENELLLLKANKDLERANSELMQFSYRSSHDLKGPLTTIRGLTQLILEDFAEEDYSEVKENIELIGKQAKSLQDLVTDLLELAKTDLLTKDLDTINFNELCDEIILLNKGLAKENDVEVSSTVDLKNDWELPRVRIYQIINNLVSNGIKYTDPKKEKNFVKIFIKDNDKEFIIQVEDNGPGIPYKNKEDVFEMFKKYHSNDISGSGIGTYILKKHIDMMNGTIDFESSETGSNFIVKLKKETLMNDFSILIVDDQETDRYILKRSIKKAGLAPTLIESSDGNEALDFFNDIENKRKELGEKFPPVIIFLDINMPLLNGFEFLEAFAKLRQEQKILETCVIMMFSSSDNEEDKKRAFSFEFVKDFITKGQATPDEIRKKY